MPRLQQKTWLVGQETWGKLWDESFGKKRLIQFLKTFSWGFDESYWNENWINTQVTSKGMMQLISTWLVPWYTTATCVRIPMIMQSRLWVHGNNAYRWKKRCAFQCNRAEPRAATCIQWHGGASMENIRCFMSLWFGKPILLISNQNWSGFWLLTHQGS